MKILTNIQTSQLGGIGQTLHSLISSIQKNNPNKVQIVGVEVTTEPNCSQKGINYSSASNLTFKHILLKTDNPYFGDIIKIVKNVSEIKETYSELIQNYIKIIKKEKPDIILLNGTYFIPWCLFQAGSQLGIEMVLHYHGILSKETSHYPIETQKVILEMERVLDNDRLLYIFPSNLAKNTVETEVFGHKIAKVAIVPNSIPDHFFKVNNKGDKNNVAFIGRWSAIKNPNFIKKISRYDKKNDNQYTFNIVSDKEKYLKNIGTHLDNITFYKPMDSRKLAKFYGEMGVVISPSFFETYGNVAQESLASGTPALIGHNMGIAQTFHSLGLSDYIVDFNSTKKVYFKIKSFSGTSVSPKVREKLKYSLGSQTINNLLIKAIKSV